MSGICSAHRGYNPNCELCGKTPEDLFGKERWAELKDRAEKAGQHVCIRCTFVFYKTVGHCPMCGKGYAQE